MRAILVAFAAIGILFFSHHAFALDEPDAGVYATVRGGVTTAIVFRVTHTGAAWALKDRRPDGSRKDATYAQGYLLFASVPTYVPKPFARLNLQNVTADGVNNYAFAFCRTTRADQAAPEYVLIAMTTARPTAIRLARATQVGLLQSA